METITLYVYQNEVYDEVAKATDYTACKMVEGDDGTRERILAGDEDLKELARFWDEAVLSVNENFKELLVSGGTKQVEREVVGDSREISLDDVSLKRLRTAYMGIFEVSKSFDKALTASIESTLRSFFIASIIAQWFKYTNKGEAADYFRQGAEMLEAAERLLYSRRKPTRPVD